MRTYTESEMIDTSEDVFIQKNFIQKNTVEEPHTHEFVELVYILSGQMENYVDDRKYDLTKGDILFVNYNQVHRYIARTDLHFVNLILKPEFMSKKLINSKNIYEIFYLFMSGEMEDIENNQPVIKLAGNVKTGNSKVKSLYCCLFLFMVKSIKRTEEVVFVNIQEYKNKVRGCWLGKNIGGTLGAPFEGYRGVRDINFYTQDMSEGVAPNDDLDLQLVWLNATERYGREINSTILGDYWLMYIVGNWSEYGAGKNNMANGLQPPLSGWYNNHNRNSDGAFIRSEIWACLMPGHPDWAVEYAYYDATVDHSQ